MGVPGDDGHGGIVDDDLRAFAPRPREIGRRTSRSAKSARCAICASPTRTSRTVSILPASFRSRDFALYPLTVVRRPLIDRAGDLANLVRWSDAVGARPGVARGMKAAE